METLKETSVLKFNPNTLREVRSLYDLYKPGRMDEAISLLENWIQKQEHFKCKKFDREYLERLIINNKGLTERAKSKLDKMCTFRTMIPEYFYCEVEELMNIRHFRDVVSYAIMRKMTPENYRVYVLKLNNTHTLTQEMIFTCNKLHILYSEYVAKHDYGAGILFVNDLRGINIMDYLSIISITELTRLLTVMQEGFSTRLKGIHYLTDSKIVESLVSLTKSVLSGKVAQRVYCHPNLESLYQMVPKEILCAEYGGDEVPIDELRNLWIDTLNSQEYKDYMKIVNELRTDESKRIGEKISDQYLPGSFRTLSVD